MAFVDLEVALMLLWHGERRQRLTEKPPNVKELLRRGVSEEMSK